MKSTEDKRRHQISEGLNDSTTALQASLITNQLELIFEISVKWK